MKKREITIVGDIAYVPLTHGYIAIIDAADAELVGQWNWLAQIRPGGKVYAGRSQWSNGKHVGIRMHRFLLDAPAGFEIDHINTDGLDNRRANLRIATTSENQRNRGATRLNTSGFKGVSFIKCSGKWRSEIKVNKKTIYLGQHATPETAYAAYCKAAKSMHAEFANYGELTRSH